MVFSRIYTTAVIIRDSSWTTVPIKNSEAITLQMAAAAGIIQKPLYPCMGREVSQPYHFLFFTGLQEIFQTRQLNLLCDKITKDRQCSQTEGLWLTRHHSNRRYISFKHNWSGWRHSVYCQRCWNHAGCPAWILQVLLFCTAVKGTIGCNWAKHTGRVTPLQHISLWRGHVGRPQASR